MKTVLKSEGTTSATQDQSSASIDTDVREARKAISQARAAERKRIVASPAEAAAGHVEDADAASKPPASSPTKASSSSCPAPSKVTAPSSPSPKKASSSSSKPIQRAAVPASHALTTKDTMRIRAVWRERIIGRRRTFVVCSGLKSLAQAKIQIYKLRDGGNYRRLHHGRRAGPRSSCRYRGEDCARRRLD